MLCMQCHHQHRNNLLNGSGRDILRQLLGLDGLELMVGGQVKEYERDVGDHPQEQSQTSRERKKHFLTKQEQVGPHYIESDIMFVRPKIEN